MSYQLDPNPALNFHFLLAQHRWYTGPVLYGKVQCSWGVQILQAQMRQQMQGQEQGQGAARGVERR